MNKKKYKILVLLASFNGEKFIKNQLDSILSQEGVDVSVLISDDNSNDDTMNIINDCV